MRTGCVIVCALTMVTASAAFAKRPMRVETRSAVEVLGITNAPPVDTGLVFIGGKYIPPPYVVGRVGNELRINGVYAENLLKWPPPPQPVFGVVTNLPPVLKTFKKTDRYFGGKHIFSDYFANCVDYFIYKGCTNRAEKVAYALERLPCIKKAYPYKDNTGVQIEWMTGGEDAVVYDVFPERFHRGRNTYYDDATMKKAVDIPVRLIGEYLKRDEYCFFPTLSDPHPRQTGRDARPMFAAAFPLIDGGASAEEISAEVERKTGAPFPSEFCRALLRHRDSLTPEFRERMLGAKER